MITNASGSGAFMMNYVLFEKCGKHWKAMEKTRLARIKSKSWIDLPVNLVLGFELAVQAER